MYAHQTDGPLTLTTQQGAPDTMTHLLSTELVHLSVGQNVLHDLFAVERDEPETARPTSAVVLHDLVLHYASETRKVALELL